MASNDAALSPAQRWWLLAAGATVCVPLAPHVPIWLALAVAFLLTWCGVSIWRGGKSAPIWMLALIGVAGAAAVFAEYRGIFGQNPGVALLLILFALKQHETRNARDGMAVVLLAYFVALTVFFYSQAIVNALLMIAATIIVTAAMGSLADARQTPRELLRRAGLMLAQAVPFLLILFLLFPRVSGPLWGLPRDAHAALSGLSDSMAPGSIGRLSLSDAIAFRAKFAGPLPPRHQLYWRGPVLTDFDGRTWRPLQAPLRRQLAYAPDAETGIEYEITLEPHNKPWLFGLELPSFLLPDSVVTHDHQMLAKQPITERRRYTLRSQPTLAVGLDERRRVLDAARTLPAGGNPRTRALGASWRESFGDDAAILNAAKTFFLRQRLIYTLDPPLLGRDDIDEFLFDTRKGFCEHFSGAFVFALRAAGVPARVVTGYQGGELNSVDAQLIVRQSDAHAWAEVWLRDQGWVRVDPTAVSVPMRIDFNLAAAVPAGDPVPLLLRGDFAWLRELRFRWEAVANTWNQWVIGFNPQRQRDFLSQLGMTRPDWRSMTATMSALSGLVLLGLAIWAIRARQRLDPAQRLWCKALRRLARRGLPHPPWEGPLAFAERVARERPELAADIRAIAAHYCAVRYAGIPNRIDDLRRRVVRFRP